MSTKEYRNVAYYTEHETALCILCKVKYEFPEARIIWYGRGYAIQVCKSGDYLSDDCRPSLEKRNSTQ